MNPLRTISARIARALDRVEARIDRPAKDVGTYLQGSEQMIDSDMAREMGRATSNKRSGFGREV